MEIPVFQIDTFTGDIFKGNPAAVCILENWLTDTTLQNIAAENNLSETAFVVHRNGSYEIRWFTPTVEIDLCGHATLAAGYVFFTFISPGLHRIDFHSSKSGPLAVLNENELFRLDFPAHPPTPCPTPELLIRALHKEPLAVHKSEDYLAVFENEAVITGISPDFGLLAQLDHRGVIITAKGNDVDFVSRFFAPKCGINEDPVTGSAHCALIPFWKSKLHKTTFRARQVSGRGGELFCEDARKRVFIAGKAVCYLKGSIFI